MITEQREDWLRQRKSGLGGSDIAAIAGLNPYRTAFDVYCDKLSLVPPVEETRRMRLGREIEPVILAEWERDRGRAVKQNHEIFRHPKKPFLLATPDALASGDGHPPVGVEAKLVISMNQRSRWGEAGTDMVPEEYLCQAAYYAAIVSASSGIEADHWEIVALFGDDIRIFPIERNADLEGELMESGERFWRDHIERRVAPVIDGSASAKEYLRKFAPANIEPLRMATPEEEASIGALIDVRSAIAALEKQEAELANRIKMAIGEADGLQSTLGKVTWKLSKDAEVVDWQGVAKALNADQSLIKRFTEIRPGTRRFLLPKLNK